MKNNSSCCSIFPQGTIAYILQLAAVISLYRLNKSELAVSPRSCTANTVCMVHYVCSRANIEAQQFSHQTHLMQHRRVVLKSSAE